jgi:hypothetical protein
MTCILGPTGSTSGYGGCVQDVAATPDTCDLGDDSSCNGHANDSCACINGSMQCTGPGQLRTCTGGQWVTSTTTGCAVPTVIGGAFVAPASLAVDADNIYVLDGGDGTVRRLAKTGGDSIVLALGATFSNSAIFVDATSVYWYGAGSLTKVSKVPGGLATAIAPVTSSGPIYNSTFAVDAANVYFFDTPFAATGAVNKVPTGGGTVSTLASMQAMPTNLVIDTSNVYWTDYFSGTLNKVSLNGGAVTTLVSGLLSPQRIAVDATSIYWADLAPNDGAHCNSRIVKSRLDGTSITVLATRQCVASLLVDGGFVYWENFSTNEPSLPTLSGSILRMPVAGGAAVMLAWDPNSFTGLALDASFVYGFIYNSSSSRSDAVRLPR